MTWKVRDQRAMRQPRVPERAVQAQIVDLLRKVGAEVYAIGTTRRKGDYQGTMMSAGIGDLYVFLPLTHRLNHPRTLWIEVKSEGGVLSEAQMAFQVRCASAGQPHIIGGLEDVTRYLQRFGWLKAA